MASLDAGALLVFALPHSPMAQPLAVIGISCAILIPGTLMALPVAASLSILGMLRYAVCIRLQLQ